MDRILRTFDGLGAGWFSLKTLLERTIAFHDDALHVIVGVLLQFVAAALLRRPVSRAAPWLAVLVLELANEASDFRHELWPPPERSAQMGEGLKDILLTMFLPTVLVLVARRFPGLLGTKD